MVSMTVCHGGQDGIINKIIKIFTNESFLDILRRVCRPVNQNWGSSDWRSDLRLQTMFSIESLERLQTRPRHARLSLFCYLVSTI